MEDSSSIAEYGDKLSNSADRDQDPLGNLSTQVYDVAGQLTASVDPLNQRTTSLYDDAGRLWAAWDALDQRTTYHYSLVSQAPILEIFRYTLPWLGCEIQGRAGSQGGFP